MHSGKRRSLDVATGLKQQASNMTDLILCLMMSAFGLAALAAAISNSETAYQSKKIQWIEHRWGRNAARAAYAVVGVLLIALGLSFIVVPVG